MVFVPLPPSPSSSNQKRDSESLHLLSSYLDFFVDFVLCIGVGGRSTYVPWRVRNREGPCPVCCLTTTPPSYFAPYPSTPTLDSTVSTDSVFTSSNSVTHRPSSIPAGRSLGSTRSNPLCSPPSTRVSGHSTPPQSPSSTPSQVPLLSKQDTSTTLQTPHFRLLRPWILKRARARAAQGRPTTPPRPPLTRTLLTQKHPPPTSLLLCRHTPTPLLRLLPAQESITSRSEEEEGGQASGRVR